MTDIKLRFFTNISHELRTPLTLIVAPIDNILQNERISQSVREQLEIVLMDSLNKRIRFLEDTVQKLGLTNVTAVHARAEELAKNKSYRERMDFCCSRAVANLSTLSEYCLPFVKKGGYFISYKTEQVQEEINQGQKAIKVLGGGNTEAVFFTLPGTDYQRSLVKIEKQAATPAKYPRKAGTPAKEPIR